MYQMREFPTLPLDCKATDCFIALYDDVPYHSTQPQADVRTDKRTDDLVYSMERLWSPPPDGRALMRQDQLDLTQLRDSFNQVLRLCKPHSPTGLTTQEFLEMIRKCEGCLNIMSWEVYYSHECPARDTLQLALTAPNCSIEGIL